MYKVVGYSFVISLCMFVIHCKTPKAFTIADLSLIAWNEDSINSITLTINRNKNFIYGFTDSSRTEYFEGRVLKKTNRDTLFLQYRNKKFPSVKEYLLVEPSRKFLIQCFENRSKCLYLRIQPNPYNHY